AWRLLIFGFSVEALDLFRLPLARAAELAAFLAWAVGALGGGGVRRVGGALGALFLAGPPRCACVVFVCGGGAAGALGAGSFVLLVAAVVGAPLGEGQFGELHDGHGLAAGQALDGGEQSALAGFAEGDRRARC